MLLLLILRAAETSDGENIVQKTFILDCLETAKDGTYCNMWHVHAMSSVLRHSIRSVCPDFDQYIRPLLNKVVTPLTNTVFWSTFIHHVDTSRSNASRMQFVVSWSLRPVCVCIHEQLASNLKTKNQGTCAHNFKTSVCTHIKETKSRTRLYSEVASQKTTVTTVTRKALPRNHKVYIGNHKNLKFYLHYQNSKLVTLLQILHQSLHSYCKNPRGPVSQSKILPICIINSAQRLHLLTSPSNVLYPHVPLQIPHVSQRNTTQWTLNPICMGPFSSPQKSQLWNL